jgi:hypothetical protein
MEKKEIKKKKKEIIDIILPVHDTDTKADVTCKNIPFT